MSTWAREIGGYLKQIRSTHDDDSVDRLNYVTTIYLLLAFALTIFAKNYVGEPLQCWVPNQWKDPWEGFAESYCFVENTYFVPMNQTSLPEVDRRESMEMIYYQWVPFILSVMAFFFYLPRAIWRGMSSYSGLALSDMMSAARAAQKKFDEKKGRQLQLYVHTLEHKTQYVGSGALRYGRSLFNLYIVMKVLIFLNLMLQFYFLNHFLGTGYVLWGFGILIDLVNGRHWHESGHFPRVAFCDITVREMGNINNWTIQCVLQVNMFNEKIFIFIWWWLAFVLFLTTINFFYWIYCRFTTAARTTFVHKLREDSGIDEGNSEMEDRFYRDVLKDDGVLVLRLLDSNAGRLQSTALFSQLWHYKFKEGINSEVASDDGDDHTQLLKKKGFSTPVKPVHPGGGELSPVPEEIHDLSLSSFDENYPSAPTASL